MVTKNQIEKIKELSILDVASKLKIGYGSKGNYRRCSCCIHDDQHPSMWLNVKNNTWYCPVCKRGGGVIDLVMEHENLSFDEACQWLVKEFSITGEGESRWNGKRMAAPTTVVHQKPLCLLPSELVNRAASVENVFCRSLVQCGIMTEQQMRRVASLYRLGTSRDGGVIFWNIDSRQRVHEGKIMYYRSDCHRDHQHNPTTVSSRLKRRGLINESWEATGCLFGEHLVGGNVDEDVDEDVDDDVDEDADDDEDVDVDESVKRGRPIVAVVESEKTAIICSQLMPTMQRDGVERDVRWLATGGLARLNVDLLRPLKGYSVILFPDTDPKGNAYSQWEEVAKEANRLRAASVYVSNVLERHATPDQKSRKIDIADWLLS